MSKSEDLFFHSLKAISPIDGRHRIVAEPLAEWFSEYALFKYRLHLEVEYLIALSELDGFGAVRDFNNEEKKFLRGLVENFSLEDAMELQNIDRFGFHVQKPINHDVKSVEYFLKSRMENSSLKDVLEMAHFGLTSEDVNNFAYNFMIRGALEHCYVPALVSLLEKLSECAEAEKNTAMLSRTHGQPATPTTFGKEMAVFLDRLRKELEFLRSIKLPAKLNGAVGNHSAQHFAAPEIDWIKFAEDFARKFGFEPNLLTTQIESHDGFTRFFSSMVSINNIVRDLSVDLWMYISAGYLIQEKVENEVGSSTMPHKINPWRVEVAEGSTVEANAKFFGFISKLQASRLQRDLSDHEAQRAIGVGVGHSLVAVLHVVEELGRLHVNRGKMQEDLADMGDILTEAIQTLLRKTGYAKPYELMKGLSRGRYCTVEEIQTAVGNLNIDEEIKQKIKSLTSENYLGLASRLADIALKRWAGFMETYQKPEKKGASMGKRYKAVIFDMDNTLVATDKFVFDLLKKVAEDLSRKFSFSVPSDDSIAAVQKKNMPFEDIFATLFPDSAGYSGEEKLWKVILAEYRSRAKNLCFFATPGGVEAVNRLRSAGLSQGIVTNRTKMAEERLKQAGYPKFDFLLAPENHEDRKPSPKIFSGALDWLAKRGIAKDEILSVGEHSDDFNASRAAGIDFVAVLTGLTTREEFLSLGLEECNIVQDLRGLKKFVERQPAQKCWRAP